ncbi:MAG: hypothetical protein LQ351_005046 [Letrouitia transgressa]|nr:MAG: hypothetical protein LQ351_005046 [Letrouitia transgressa]
MEASNTKMMRQPLQSLKTNSTVLVEKKKSTHPPSTPTTEQSCPVLLTPPITPPKPDVQRASASSDAVSLVRLSLKDEFAEGSGKGIVAPSKKSLRWDETLPQPVRKQYWILGSSSSGHEEFGRGVWSIVFRAIETHDLHSSQPLTPPRSPVSGSSRPSTSGLLAIKKPARRDAYNILRHEARILTYLHSFDQAAAYLVPFHGYDASRSSLVFDAVPLNLDTHAATAAKSARANFSTKTMYDPVTGIQSWQSLAQQLITGLAFLHDNGCIHGDIKPANILLRPGEPGSSQSFAPLYCDFSSAAIEFDHSSQNTSQHQITALTPDFTSPELFSSLLGTSNTVATPASDVYALGVTLLVAAIGESPYAGVRLEMQKLSMAREGKVLEFARQGSQGTRVMRGRGVERCLKGALEKGVEERWGTKKWMEEVEQVVGSWS